MAEPRGNEVPLSRVQDLLGSVEKVIHGKRESVTLVVAGLLAEGHVLLEDVPGTGKTTLARALARSVGGEFRRIQFTSDLLPSDVLGVTVYSPEEESFRFHPGPIFANIVLADELNRTSPRTQSSLLECMNERCVSLDGVSRDLPRPFLVIATQNPTEFEGTYPLPESQLDRFLMRVRMGYPSRPHERKILLSRLQREPMDLVQPVLTIEETLGLIRATRQVRFDPLLAEYVLNLLAASRRDDRLLLGLSPRAGVGLTRAAQAIALSEGRDYCIPDDIKRLALPVLAHRLIPSPLDGYRARSGEEILREILETTPVPH